MLILFRTCLILSLFILSPSELFAQETKEQKIVKLIELTNGQDMAEQMIQALMPVMRQQLKAAAPQITDAHVEESLKALTEEFTASTKHLMNALIPLYSKVLDDKELDAALGFYNTPEGKSMSKKMPQLMQGGMQIGQQWGAQVGQRAAQKVIQKARALGYQI